MSTVLVAGGGGFIGGHLVARLLESGRHVISVDVKPPAEWHQHHDRADNRTGDLSRREQCEAAVEGVDQVFNLAADMGGMGFIESNKARCMMNVLIDAHLLAAALATGVERFFYASSACVYPQDRQATPGVAALAERDAYPADPEDGYGWEKLYGERLCRHFREDFGLETRAGRYHNVYGPNGTWDGGREKVPAAICRKIAEARMSDRHQIEIWGDGNQTRSFTYIDDAIDGTLRLHESDVADPLNLGSSEMVSINELVEIVSDIAGVRVRVRHDLDRPQGVRGRNSDNTLVRRHLGWEPSTPLREGLEITYAWIHDQVAARG